MSSYYVTLEYNCTNVLTSLTRLLESFELISWLLLVGVILAVQPVLSVM